VNIVLQLAAREGAQLPHLRLLESVSPEVVEGDIFRLGHKRRHLLKTFPERFTAA
jgi:hypothetical protein